MEEESVTRTQLLISSGWDEYQLLDSGNGAKLERYGNYVVIRPESQALWSPSRPQKEWDTAHAVFLKKPGIRGEWVLKKDIPQKWQLTYKGLTLSVALTEFGHVGIFPEQQAQWEWIAARLQKATKQLTILNLFGYTGVASLVAAQHGAAVTHVDASRPSVGWARDNQQLSDLGEKPLRWIIEDAVKYVKREARRGVTYDGIIMDPPQFGRGPKGELWQFENDFVPLLHACRAILSSLPSFVGITAYATSVSPLSLGNMLGEIMHSFEGEVRCGETTLQESESKRLLPAALYARWESR